MSDMLHELENNEAILLMYIAGELPEEERREVEQMLIVDESLRRMHESLRAGWQGAMAGIESLDAAEPASFSRDVAARQVGRMVRQWHASKLAMPSPQRVEVKRLRMTWWQSTLGMAAALLIGFLVWWGYAANTDTVQLANDTSLSDDEAVAIMGVPSVSEFGGLSEATQRELSVVSAVDFTGFASAELGELENLAQQLEALSEQ